MAAPALSVADATKKRDGHDFLNFTCWSGDPDEEYVAEVDAYVRRVALQSFYKTLSFRLPDRTLVGVSGFDLAEIRPHEAARYIDPGWHLQVIAVSRRYQGTLVTSELPRCPPEMRIAEYILRKTFARMLELDPSRLLVRARVHDDNRRSIAVCKRVGLERTERESESDEYWRMFGKVDPYIGCPQ